MTDIRDEQVDIQVRRLRDILTAAAARGLMTETPEFGICKDLQDKLDDERATPIEISQAFSRFYANNAILKARPEDIGPRLWLASKTLARLAP